MEAVCVQRSKEQGRRIVEGGLVRVEYRLPGNTVEQGAAFDIQACNGIFFLHARQRCLPIRIAGELGRHSVHGQPRLGRLLTQCAQRVVFVKQAVVCRRAGPGLISAVAESDAGQFGVRNVQKQRVQPMGLGIGRRVCEQRIQNLRPAGGEPARSRWIAPREPQPPQRALGRRRTGHIPAHGTGPQQPHAGSQRGQQHRSQNKKHHAARTAPPAFEMHP